MKISQRKCAVAAEFVRARTEAFKAIEERMEAAKHIYPNSHYRLAAEAIHGEREWVGAYLRALRGDDRKKLTKLMRLPWFPDDPYVAKHGLIVALALISNGGRDAQL